MIIYTDETLDHLSPFETEQVYNALDCGITTEILLKRLPHLDEDTSRVYAFERALQAPVLEMNLRGIRLDPAEVHNLLADLHRSADRLTLILRRLCEEGLGLPVINPGSPKQIADLLYRDLAIPYRKSKTGGPATDRETLESLETFFHARPFLNTILALRDTTKLIGVFKKAVSSDNRIRCSYNISGTKTGRFSSSSDAFGEGTNLQTITERLRVAFIPDPGMKMAYFDLEQAESRAVAYLAYMMTGGLDNYLKACESGDLHTTVCTMIWPEVQDRKSADQIFYRFFSYRDLAKRGGHGCLSEDHEVLTPEGWVPISLVQNNEPIMAWDHNTKRARWEIPSHWERKPWHGEIYELIGRAYSLEVTSDHRMPLIKRANGKALECAGEQVFQHTEKNLCTKFIFEGGTADVTPEQARLCAATQADGHVYSNGAVRFGFRKERKIKRIFSLLGSRKTKIIDRVKEVTIHLPKDSVDFPTQKQAGPWMLDWPLESLQAWVDELQYWDGTVQPRFTWIYGKDREHMQWVYYICKLVGQGASYNANTPHDCARVGLNKRSGVRIGSLYIKQKPGLGRMVYCPTVESGGFIVRRHGHIMGSLNTNYYGKPYTMARHLKVSKELMEAFQAQYFQAFPEIRKWHYETIKTLQLTGQLRTPLGRTRTFFGRLNDDTTIRSAIAQNPQSLVGDTLNIGLYKVWQANHVQILAQVHDAILFQYPIEQEREVLSETLSLMEVPIPVGDRTLRIPVEGAVGWNWAKASPTNPHGLKKWKGYDDREFNLDYSRGLLAARAS